MRTSPNAGSTSPSLVTSSAAILPPSLAHDTAAAVDLLGQRLERHLDAVDPAGQDDLPPGLRLRVLHAQSITEMVTNDHPEYGTVRHSYALVMLMGMSAKEKDFPITIRFKPRVVEELRVLA